MSIQLGRQGQLLYLSPERNVIMKNNSLSLYDRQVAPPPYIHTGASTTQTLIHNHAVGTNLSVCEYALMF